MLVKAVGGGTLAVFLYQSADIPIQRKVEHCIKNYSCRNNPKQISIFLHFLYF